MKYEDTLKEIADEQAAKAGLESTETEETVEETQSEESEPKEFIITDEMVKEWGLPKEMAGKPLSEAGKSYRNLQKEFTHKS